MSDKKHPDRNQASWASRVTDGYVDAVSALDGEILGPDVERADKEYAAALRNGDLITAVGKRLDSFAVAARGAIERSPAATLVGHTPSDERRTRSADLNERDSSQPRDDGWRR